MSTELPSIENDFDFETAGFMAVLLSRQHQTLTENITKLRTEITIEAIHDARVAIRATKSLLKSFSPLLKRRARRELVDQINEFNPHLEPIRNLDALLSLTAKLENQHVQTVLREELIQQRATEVNRLEQSLTEPIVEQLWNRFAEFSLHPPVSKSQLELSNLEQYRNIIYLIEESWIHLFDQILKLPNKPRPSQLHLVRIATKHCRYTYQAVGQLGIHRNQQLEVWTKSLQQRLGQIQDQQTYITWISHQRFDAVIKTQALDQFFNAKPSKRKLLSGIDLVSEVELE